ncbi:hypothetical protein [Paraburkholderia kururiensis]|uniref:hypothetical protein n=1 Tax=Paraburkholderia kururiensis TaxID=984307 RepID=UPI0005AB737A|nr:hypothetical protein [Paraburkholderia kururiensis]
MKLRPKKTVIGTATCHCCGREIPVKRSETGTLDMSCQWCDLPMYAKAGTEAHKRLMERVTLIAEPDPDPTHPEPVPAHVPPAEVKPAARAARSVFDLMAGRE